MQEKYAINARSTQKRNERSCRRKRYATDRKQRYEAVLSVLALRYVACDALRSLRALRLMKTTGLQMRACVGGWSSVYSYELMLGDRTELCS